MSFSDVVPYVCVYMSSKAASDDIRLVASSGDFDPITSALSADRVCQFYASMPVTAAARGIIYLGCHLGEIPLN